MSRRIESVHGIGEATARELHARGIRSLDDLRRESWLLTPQQRIALEWHEHLMQRIPRREVDEYIARLRAIIEALAPDTEWTVGGSFRRGREDCGDIDVLMRAPSPSTFDVVEALDAAGLLVGTLSLGPRKFMGLVRLPGEGRLVRRIDVRIFDAESWPYALLYNTGSREFVVRTRMAARALGLKLNEYGLTELNGRGRRFAAECEADVLRHIGMEWVPPHKREA